MSALTEKIEKIFDDAIFVSNIDKKELKKAIIAVAEISEAGGGASVIPLNGTTEGNPVSGNIEIKSEDFAIVEIFQNDLANGFRNALQFNTDAPSFRLISEGISDTSYVDLTSGFLSLYTSKATIEINTKDAVDGGRGLEGMQDYSQNITDLDYTQKKYVDQRGSVVNTTNATLSASDLNTAYPNAKDGFSVIAPNVIGGGKYYIKAGAGWVYQQILAVV